MEPINATVSVTPGRIDVWSPTQNQSTALELAADQAGVSTEKVFVHTVFLGGGFGGNGSGGMAVRRLPPKPSGDALRTLRRTT